MDSIRLAGSGRSPHSPSLSLMPSVSALKKVQRRSFVVKNRCLADMDALPTHSAASESQCASFSGLLRQTQTELEKSCNAACSAAMPEKSVTGALNLALICRKRSSLQWNEWHLQAAFAVSTYRSYSSVPGCSISPAAILAKRLKGFVPVVNKPVEASMKPA